MSQSYFFVYFFCLKLINCWLLMCNVCIENVFEYSLQVVMVVYVLVVIKNCKFGGQVNVECIVLLVMYYDVLEVLIGDFFILVKYFNLQIVQEYKVIEKIVQ